MCPDTGRFTKKLGYLLIEYDTNIANFKAAIASLQEIFSCFSNLKAPDKMYKLEGGSYGTTSYL